MWTPTPQPAFLGFDPAAGGLCGGLHGHIETAPAGRLFMPKGHCGNPWIAISENGGDWWKRVKVSDMKTAQPHLAVASDAAGNLYFVWRDAEKRLPYMSISRDHGSTWGTPMMIAPPGVTEVNFPVIVISPAGQAWSSASDDCVARCVTPGDATAMHNGQGIVVRQLTGPTLRAPAQ